MPINGLSENIRMPRLGKFHLGRMETKMANGQPVLNKEGKPIIYPVKTDYFVLEKNYPDKERVFAIIGEKPKELHVLIPLEDPEKWASQYYKCYDATHGLVCKGDGLEAVRMIDIKTKSLPSKLTETVTSVDMECRGRECPEYKTKKCGEVMNLLFMLPELPGVGVWQIDTGSINSILNINSCARIIKQAYGRIAMIPLKLTLEPKEVNNPESGKKQTVFVLHLRTDLTLPQLAEATRNQNKLLRLEAPLLEAVYEENAQRDIDELWESIPGGGKNVQTKIIEGEVVNPPPVAPETISTPPAEPVREKAQAEALPYMSWLKNALDALQWADAGKYLKEKYGVTGARISLMVNQLKNDQREEFTAEVVRRLAEMPKL